MSVERRLQREQRRQNRSVKLIPLALVVNELLINCLESRAIHSLASRAEEEQLILAVVTRAPVR